MNLVATVYSPDIEYSNPIGISDHLDGFDEAGENWILRQLDNKAKEQGERCEVVYHQLLPDWVHQQYSNLDIRFDALFQQEMNFKFFDKRTEPVKPVKPVNFTFTLLGSPHIGRKLLCGTMLQRGLINFDYTRKNMGCTVEELDNHVVDLSRESKRSEVMNHNIFVHKDQSVLETVQHGEVDYSTPVFDRLYQLENSFVDNFVHIVSETLSTSSVPFVTEKFLYSVYAEGLWLVNAQPGWHQHIEEVYGFKLFRSTFDYEFDSVRNPLDRLTEMFGMLSKYQHCSTDEWQDIVKSEQETIQFNKEHLLSGQYLKCMLEHDTWKNGKLSGRVTDEDLLKFEQLVKGK